MQVYISNKEIEDIAEGLVRTVYNQRLPKQIDIDAVAGYLGISVIYEQIAEDDMDKIGFASNGRTPLKVRRNGMIQQTVYPKDTIVLDTFLLRPEEQHRRRFTEGHEIAHILLNRADPFTNAACFNRVYDPERAYSLEELRDRMMLGESQANVMAAYLLRPRSLLEAAVNSHFHRKKVPVYGNCVFLPEMKPSLQTMADELGVSHTAMLIQLRKYDLLEQRDMNEYFQKTRLSGGTSDGHR